MTDSVRFSIPSKAFILGEYAVLRGAPALVATFAPRFELMAEGRLGRRLAEFPPEAPVRRFLDSSGDSGAAVLEWRFLDPHQGAGGFGGSTAEFALAYAATHGASAPVSELWSEYLSVQPQASGADLAAQWSGGAVIADPKARKVFQIRAGKLFKNFFVFSAAHQSGRKVKTHEHLEILKNADLDGLAASQALSEGLQAARRGEFESFARAVNAYADELQARGFELPQTTEDRFAFRDVPGVCAVKGTGAMQADAVIAFGDPEEDSVELYRRLVSLAEKRNLRLVQSGWQEEPGILP